MTPESMRIHTIAAVANNGVIGKDNDLVWTLRDDMKFFMNTTKGHVVITGRKNYESIPAKFRPLKDRVNVVVTRNKDYEAPGALVVHSLADAFEEAKRHGDKTCFVIGGGQIYREALALGVVDVQYITHVDAEPEGDTHYPVDAWQGWSAEAIAEGVQDDRHDHAYRIVKHIKP